MTTLSHEHHRDDHPLTHGETEHKVDLKIIAVLFGCTILLTAIAARFIFDSPDQADLLAMLASILLGTPIVYGAVKSLVSGKCSHDHGDSACDDHHHDPTHSGSHMEELVAIAIVASFASGNYLECASVAFFMLIASLIEHRTAVGALQTIESLIRITPTRAVLITDDGEKEVAAADLKPGDRVLVLPGDNIPGDGVVREGASTVDQANITGESLPVEKQIDDDVFGGTINQTGRMEIEITRAGEDSTLGKVQSLILQAAQTRPAVVRELSKYTAYYTPIVLMLAAMIFVFTGDLTNSISLLLIACPCALILAGPTAIVAALSAAARVGVLVKSVSDLEVVRRVNAFVFDKTGTLTTGNLSVMRMRPAQGIEPAQLLRVCVSAEQGSRHPVARAVIKMAQKARVTAMTATASEEVAGRGVKASVEGGTIWVGRESWLQEQGIDTASIDHDGAEGLSLLFVAQNDQCLGWVGLADTPRVDAAASVAKLGELGVQRRIMITGDRWSPARHIAQNMSLTDVQAEAMPGDKLKLVEDLKRQGYTVAVIGDGVNDGPALAAGHVSIAMGAAGSDVAVNSASIALMNNQLDRLPFLLILSRHTVTVIRQNLIGTLVYIVFMLALLSVGYMTPLIAAIGHGISSIIVIFNSARLVREGEHIADHVQSDDQTETRTRQIERVHPQPATA